MIPGFGMTVSKWLCFIPHKLSTYSYLFIFSSVCTGYHSARLVCPFACGALKLRVSRPGGRAKLSCSPRPTLTTPISNSSFLRFVWGQNSASHHKTLFNCLPYFFNYCLLVISTLLPFFNFFVQIFVLTLLRIFSLFSGFFSL